MTIHDIREKLIPKYVKESRKILTGLPEEQAEGILKYIVGMLLEEVRKGVDGEIGPSEAPFFAVVDQMYEAAKVKGCYFCDRDIDPNETPFVPGKTEVCLTCRMKFENVVKAPGTSSPA